MPRKVNGDGLAAYFRAPRLAVQLAETAIFARSLAAEKIPHPSEDGEAMHLMEPTQEIIPRHWFAVYTQSRHEKSLAKYLDHRKIEHYLPLYSSKRKWSDGSRVTLSLPLFPGYVFVRIARDERVRVLTLPGALQIITGTGGELSPIADSMIATLRDGLLERDAQPHPLLTEGQRARIRSGALAGMEGIVIRHKSNLRVVLTIEMIMRSIAVEVNGEDLEPVSSPWYDDLQESA